VKYRKKPIEIEATQWFKNGDHPEDLSDYLSSSAVMTEGKVVRRFRRPDIHGDQACNGCSRPFHDHGWIDTLEGGHWVCPGDFIITGIKGEMYPCKPDIFEQTYEFVK